MHKLAMCKSVITIDYDIEWNEEILEWVRKRAEKIGAASIYCEKSTNNGIHCTICYPRELSDAERLVLETVLLDDPVRIMNNLKRLCITGKMYDVLFEVKIKRRSII